MNETRTNCVSVIIPAHNEEDCIGETVRAVRTRSDVEEVIVVDDGSCDDTAHEAQSGGAKLVRLPRCIGKGGALRAGVGAARGDLLLFLDADLRESAAAAHRLLEPLRRDEADMTIAVFPHQQKGGGMGLVVRLARWGLKQRCGRTFKAPLSGQRALRRCVWDAMGGNAKGFGVEVALTQAAMRHGFRVLELELPLRHRVTGRTLPDIWHRSKQFWDVGRALCRP